MYMVSSHVRERLAEPGRVACPRLAGGCRVGFDDEAVGRPRPQGRLERQLGAPAYVRVEELAELDARSLLTEGLHFVVLEAGLGLAKSLREQTHHIVERAGPARASSQLEVERQRDQRSLEIIR